MRNEILLDVRRAYAEVVAGNHAIRTYESEIIPQSKQMTELARASYEAGTINFTSLLQIERDLKGNQIDHLKALAVYEVSLAELQYNVGDELR